MKAWLIFGLAGTMGGLRMVAIVAALICVAMIVAGLLLRTRRMRIATWTVAVVAGITALGCALALPQFQQGLAVPWKTARPTLIDPRFWGLLLCSSGLYLMLPKGSYRARIAGYVLGVVGLAAFAAALPLSLSFNQRAVFRVLALVTVGSAAAAVAMRSAVYSAIWFALSLMGVAGLFFFQGAQFLAVATVIVYAGAIVVTFLFVIMLAQPEGHAIYDRITWGQLAKLSSVATSALFVAVLTFLLFRGAPEDARWQVARALPLITSDNGDRLLRDDQLVDVNTVSATGERLQLELVLRSDVSAESIDQLQRELPEALRSVNSDLDLNSLKVTVLPKYRDVLARQHMAHLGRELFSHHLVSVEIAGTVLLAALVGAVAIVSHGHPRRQTEETAP